MNLWARAGLALLGTLAALLVLELGLRALPEPDGFSSRMRLFRDAVLVADGRGSWAPRAGAEVKIAGIPYRFDGDGCRRLDAGPGAQGSVAPGDTREVLLLAGDSMAMGWGVAADASFAGRLAQAHPEARLCNAGVVGYNLEQSIGRIEALLPRLPVRRVLLAYFANDPEPLGGLQGDGWPRARLWTRLAPLWHALRIRLGWAADVSAYHRALHAPGSEGWTRVLQGLDRLAALCRTRHLDCTLALVPELQAQPYALADVHARLRTAAAERGLQLIDLAPAIAGRSPQTLWVAPDDAHPNAEGHRLLAGQLEADLFATPP